MSGRLNMRTTIFLPTALLFILAGCNSQEKNKTVALVQTNNANQNWVASFKDFRTALYQNDKATLKSFFKFPVVDKNNEIWYLIEDEHPPVFEKGEIKPFTETDFNNYYFKVFDQYFTNSLLKIKTKELLDKGEYDTEFITEKEVSYRIYAKYDKKSRQIILNFYTEEKFEIDDTGEYEKAEFSKIYYFDVLPNNKIQFNKVRLAG